MSKLYNSKPEDLDKQKRNNFDLSFQTNGTFRFGRLYPVFSKFALANQSMRIKPTIGLRSLAMNFPTQTRMKVNLSWFSVPLRYVWDNWQEWLTMSDDARKQYGSDPKNIVFPRLSVRDKYLKTGSLFDWLGLPTTFATDLAIVQTMFPDNLFGDTSRSTAFHSGVQSIAGHVTDMRATPLSLTSAAANIYAPTIIGTKTLPDVQVRMPGVFLKDSPLGMPVYSTTSHVNIKTIGVSNGSHQFQFVLYAAGHFYKNVYVTASVSNNQVQLAVNSDAFLPVFNAMAEISANGKECRIFVGCDSFSGLDVLPVDQNYKSLSSLTFDKMNTESVVDAVDANVKPFSGSNPSLRLSPLKARCYEAICNSYYRNPQIDPFILNGHMEFEKFCNTSDGVDTYDYDYHNRTWEDDQFTTMHPSPQMGDSPLVGLSVPYGSDVLEETLLTIRETMPAAKLRDGQLDGIAPRKEYKFAPVVEDNIIVGFKPEDFDCPTDLKDIVTSIKCGWTINDMRNATALQRYLEARIRSNFRYKTMMKDVYHTEVSADTLRMPDYLGGTTTYIDVNTIVNQTGGENNLMLGDFGANCTCLKNDVDYIDVYCNEHSYVFGILSIVPIPTYSQLLSPDLLVPDSPLDIYNEAFANIGKQPVYAKYITPLQRAAESGKSQDEVIGYQRPWWQYLQNNDEIHGDMRKDYAGFVITRLFRQTPKLNRRFIECDAASITTPFPDKTLDTFLGMIYFDIESKMPLPKYDTIHL